MPSTQQTLASWKVWLGLVHDSYLPLCTAYLWTSSQPRLNPRITGELLEVPLSRSHPRSLWSEFGGRGQVIPVSVTEVAGTVPPGHVLILSQDPDGLLLSVAIWCAFFNGRCFLGNAQLALQIIRRNQLLPAVKTFSEMRRKPVFQPVHPSQPLQMPAFTVQRKWCFALRKLLPEIQGSIFGTFYLYHSKMNKRQMVKGASFEETILKRF